MTMICVVKQGMDGEITGWMMGADVPDLRRRAEQTFDHDLAALFYQMEFTPTPGKHVIAPGITMLVE
jgi:hypothetical protein